MTYSIKEVADMYNHQIMSEKTFDRITGWDDIKDKEKDDYDMCL